MSLLPSGRHFCIDDLPLPQLLQGLRFNGLRLPELIAIESILDLRPYLRFMWLLPIGADTKPNSVFHSLSAPVPYGLTMVESGHTLACLPDELDESDRAAVEEFWLSDRCIQFAKKRFARIEVEREKITLSEAPEDRLLAKWFEGETTRRNRTTEAEIYALLIENGTISQEALEKKKPPPPRMSHPL